MRKLMAAVAVFGVACGGGGDETGSAESTPDAMTATPAPEAAAPAPTTTGTVHEVAMKLTDAGAYVFEPASLTIKVGDTVRWINESGPPHNVAFYVDQVPEGASDFLTQAFASDAMKIGPMASRLMTQVGDTYEISFAGAATGDYGYFCTPHEALGMKATLTVEE